MQDVVVAGCAGNSSVDVMAVGHVQGQLRCLASVSRPVPGADEVPQAWSDALALLGVPHADAVCLVEEQFPDAARVACQAAGLPIPVVTDPVGAASWCISEGGSGSVLSVGLDVLAVRCESGQVVSASGGRGWVLGGEGSEPWIGQQLLRTALDQLEVGVYSALCVLIARAWNVPTLTQEVVLERTYRDSRFTEKECAKLATILAGGAGEEAIDAVCNAAAMHLARSVWSVTGVRRGPVALIGSVLCGPVGEVLTGLLPDPVLRTPTALPGAILLGLHRAGAPWRQRTVAQVLTLGST